MSCNWELFELRLRVWTVARMTASGKFQGLTGVEFNNVILDLPYLGIRDFQGSGYMCNFAHVFGQIADLKTIPVSISRQIIRTATRYYDPMPSFGVLQQAEKNGKILPAVLLYVHRRDQSDLVSLQTGVGVWMEDVTVIFTAIDRDYYVQLNGNSAKVVNP